MSSEDIFQAEPSAGATSTPSAFRRMTNKLLPTSSPMTPEHAPRRPRPPAAREPVPQSNDSSPSYSPSGPPLTQDPLSNMDVTASVVQQLRHASRRNATLEAARAETAEKIRLLEEEILKMTGKNDRLTNENRKLGERMWELENEHHLLQEKFREQTDLLTKKEKELRALMERSRKAFDLVEDNKAAETASRKERDDLVHQLETTQANLRRLRHEWQLERADLMRQLQDLMQETEEHRRATAFRGMLSNQSSTSNLALSPPVIDDEFTESPLLVPPSPHSPPTPVTSGAQLPDSPKSPTGDPLGESIKRAAADLMQLLGQMDSSEILSSSDTGKWDAVLASIQDVYRAIERQTASFGGQDKEPIPDGAGGSLPQIGSSLLTIFEQGSRHIYNQADVEISDGEQNQKDSEIETARIPADGITELEMEAALTENNVDTNGALWQVDITVAGQDMEALSGASQNPELVEVTLPVDESLEGSREQAAAHLRPPAFSENVQRRPSRGRADRPKSLFFSTLASISDAVRRFSMHEKVHEEVDESDAASQRSASSVFETTPLDLAQPSMDTGLFALTQCMVGSKMLKYNKYGKRPQERFLWVNPFTGTLHWSTQDPAIETAGSKVKTSRITGIMEEIDTQATTIPRRRPVRSLVVQTPSRQIRLVTATQEEHVQWLSGLGELLRRQGGRNNRLTIFVSNDVTTDQ